MASDLSESVKGVVSQLYSVKIAHAWPILSGDYSQVFHVEDDSGKAYIIKTHESYNEAGAAVIAYLQSINYRWMPKQYLSQNGKVWEQCEDNHVSLQDYVDSPQSLMWNSQVDDDCLGQLGAALHDLHELKIPKELAVQLPHETYAPKYLKDWQEIEAKIIAGGDSITTKLRNIKSDYDAKLTEIIDRSTAIGKNLESQSRELCLVHGDFHLGNIIKPKSGQIYVVDWDFPAMSLPENDMMILINPDRVKKIAAGYKKAGFPEPYAHAYYSLGKILRGLWVYGSRAVDIDRPEAKREQAVVEFHGMLLDDSDADQSLNFARSLD